MSDSNCSLTLDSWYWKAYGDRYSRFLRPIKARFGLGDRHCFAKRRANKQNATVAWSEERLIAVIYEKAVLMGMQVDHVVPLTSPLVCGLHVWSNLQLLSSRENSAKGNREWPDMPADDPV